MSAVRLLLKSFLLIGALTCNCNGQELRRRTTEFYKVSSNMEWKLFTVDPIPFSIPRLYYFENTSSQFFDSLIRSSPLFSNQNIYMTSFGVKDQIVDNSNDLSTIVGEVTIMYTGNEIDDFSDSLKKIFSNDEAENLRIVLARSGFFSEKSSSSTRIEFSTNGDSAVLAHLSDNQVLFYTLIGMVSFLVVISLVILISSLCTCCNKNESEQLQGGLKKSNTEDTAGSFPNPSPDGLGARGRVVEGGGSAYKFTPQQRKPPHGYYPSDTPCGQDSYTTPGSMNSKNALGIVKMSTLNKMMYDPQYEQPHSKHAAAIYSVGLNDESPQSGQGKKTKR